jgi:hypothetical protein
MLLEFEPCKEGWLDRLKAQPVDVLVLEQDIRLPASNHWIWEESSGVKLVITRQPLRRGSPMGWTQSCQKLNHQELGGVTNWNGTFFVFQRQLPEQVRTFWEKECFASVPGQFNHLVLDAMAGGISSPPPGPGEFDSSQEMFELNSWTQSSRNVIKRKRYRLPNRLSPTGFVRRGLTIDEGLSLFDIPATLTSKMPEELRKLLLPNMDAPLKVISPVAQCIGRWVSRNMGAGGGVFSRSTTKTRRKNGRSA